MKKNIMYTRGDRLVLFINYILLTVVGLVVLYPLLYVLSASFSPDISNLTNYTLIPREFTLNGYKVVFEYKRVWTGYGNSLLYTTLFTLISLLVTVCAAYPLSVPNLQGKKILMFIFVFTMYFSGGLIPSFLLMRDLGILNKLWVMILPGAMSTYNMIIMRTYFMSQIPFELREASELEGCGNIRYLLLIVLPLSGPILAVIALYCAVGAWNSYFNAMIYLNAREKYPLQLILREILIISTEYDLDTIDPERLLEREQRATLMKYSLIIVSSLPMLILYPFVQKFFVKGVMIGSLKG